LPSPVSPALCYLHTLKKYVSVFARELPAWSPAPTVTATFAAYAGEAQANASTAADTTAAIQGLFDGMPFATCTGVLRIS